MKKFDLNTNLFNNMDDYKDPFIEVRPLIENILNCPVGDVGKHTKILMDKADKIYDHVQIEMLIASVKNAIKYKSLWEIVDVINKTY